MALPQLGSWVAPTYGDLITTELAVRPANLMRFCRMVSASGTKHRLNVEVSNVEVKRAPTPGTQLIPVSLASSERWVEPIDFDVGPIQFFGWEKWHYNVDPEPTVIMNLANAWRRNADQLFLDTVFASAPSGANGNSSTVFDTANSIAVDYPNSVNTGITFEKLMQVRQLALVSHAWNGEDPLYAVVNAKQLAELANVAQIASRDHSVSPVFGPTGFVQSFYGINFIHSELVETSGGNYAVPVFVQDAVTFATWDGLRTTAWVDNNVAQHPVLFHQELTMGAARTHESKVFRIYCEA